MKNISLFSFLLIGALAFGNVGTCYAQEVGDTPTETVESFVIENQNDIVLTYHCNDVLAPAVIEKIAVLGVPFVGYANSTHCHFYARYGVQKLTALDVKANRNKLHYLFCYSMASIC